MGVSIGEMEGVGVVGVGVRAEGGGNGGGERGVGMGCGGGVDICVFRYLIEEVEEDWGRLAGWLW